MPTVWTDTLDKQLLLQCLHQNDVKPKNWKKVAEGMGEGFTAASCQQHFAKVKAMVESGEKGTAAGTSQPTTPGKKTPATPKGTKAGGDPGDGGDTPSKKTRGVKEEGEDTGFLL